MQTLQIKYGNRYSKITHHLLRYLFGGVEVGGGGCKTTKWRYSLCFDASNYKAKEASHLKFGTEI
jgi:hypothetical protein